MKTKPFNLEEALVGKPCVTRDGRKVLEIHCMKNNIEWPVLAVIEKERLTIAYDKEGVFIKGENSNEDLFMAHEPQVYCIGIMHLKSGYNLNISTYAYPKEFFDEYHNRNKFLKVVEFTLDEVELEFKEVGE